MRAILIVLAVTLSVATVAQAQVTPEIRPYAGALVPMGNQRDVIKDAVLTGAQVAVEAADAFHLVGTFGFAGPSFRQQFPSGGHVHIYQGDVGGELFRNVSMADDWKFRPFLGAGVGVRTYDLTEVNGSKSYFTGYGALGAEFQLSKVAIRFEGRDYMTRFKGLDGNLSAKTRNELALTGGLALHIR